MNLNVIRRYHELGVVVHPLCPPHHYCNSPGKIPYDPLEKKHLLNWQGHENFTLEAWEEWLDLEPAINIGMLCGQKSRLVGIDVDDDEAEDFVEELDPGETWSYTTGRGRRLLYRWDGPLKSGVIRGEAGQKLEVLADGRNNVLPPSIHPSGKTYAWVPGMTPKEMPEPAALPSWALGGPSPAGAAEVTSDSIDWLKVAKDEFTSGSRNITATRIAGWLLSPAPHTQREALWILALINAKYAQPPLSMEELKAIVLSINRRQEKSDASLKVKARELASSMGVSFDTALAYLQEGIV